MQLVIIFIIFLVFRLYPEVPQSQILVTPCILRKPMMIPREQYSIFSIIYDFIDLLSFGLQDVSSKMHNCCGHCLCSALEILALAVSQDFIWHYVWNSRQGVQNKCVLRKIRKVLKGSNDGDKERLLKRFSDDLMQANEQAKSEFVENHITNDICRCFMTGSLQVNTLHWYGIFLPQMTSA